ncbi:DUF3592 domain-containing protein [Celeribacter halophilus]|uniref:DUF3592 domain-containing protein n=1 Tax=Celeribacter halophilus TaxID=576117 RepID=A0AAW7XW37_9RHOB|nr:DUF3592 domain-containing protein [Celeribacter halophilus]MDO6458666.1 DUF3592 domain-containing protein [Celeribacter halophilus]
MLVAAGVGFGAFKISEYQKVTAHTDHGVKVVGQVTNLHETITNKPNTYSVSYIFATEADPNNRGLQRVREQLFDTLSDGGPVDVWYLPVDPEQSVVDLGDLTRYFWLALLCSAGLIFTGLVGGWFAAKRARATIIAQDRQRHEGRLVFGHSQRDSAQNHLICSAPCKLDHWGTGHFTYQIERFKVSEGRSQKRLR